MRTDVWMESSSRMAMDPTRIPNLAMERLKAEARLLHHLRQIPLQREGWEAWQSGLRAQIWERLGTPPARDLPLDLRVCNEIRRPGYRMQNIIYQSRPGFYVTGSLYLPDGPGPFPGVLSVHGHERAGRLSVQVRGHVLAQSGYVCLIVDAFGSGERCTQHGEFEYHGAHFGAALFDVGETLMGMQIVDNMRGIGLLQSLPKVDTAHIGVTGASGGGNQTMWLAAMDDRVTAAVPVVSVGTFEAYVGNPNCICETFPDGLKLTEEGGVLALVAPRALLICTSNSDGPTFCPAEMLRSFDAAQQAYRLLGCEGRIVNRIFRHGHGYWPEVREAMLGWFDRWLKGVGDGSPHAEPAFTPFEEKELFCFPRGKRPETVKTIAVFCRERAASLALERGADRIDPVEKRRALRVLLRQGEPLELREWTEYPAIVEGDAAWRRITIVTKDGMIFPLLLRNGNTEDCQLVAHGKGKAEAVQSDVWPAVADTRASVALVDLWGVGETDSGDHGITRHHDFARGHLWVGRTLMGEWVRSLEFLGKILRSEFGFRTVSLVGIEEGGLAALFCGALGEWASITVYDTLLTYAFGEKPRTLSMGIHVPGMLRWGDVPLLAALNEHPVRIERPRLADGSVADRASIDAFVNAAAGLRQRAGTKGYSQPVARANNSK